VGAAAAAVGALALLAGAAAGGAPWTQRGSALGSGGLRVSFLDVGQGDATLLQDGRRAVLVDAGPPDGPILARLRSAGVGRLDVLVVTHQQADHEGGAAAVLRAHAVGLLVDGGVGARTPGQAAIARAAADRRMRAIAPDAGQVIRVGRLELRVLWPPREPAGAPPAGPAGADPNQRAIVLHVRDGAFDLLLPADAESDVTAGLPLEPVEALKVAHHGSADPGLPALLARLRPRIAAIEVGAHNPYGHPAPATLRALRAVPRVYRTDRDGTVRLTVARDGEMHVETGP
jgi:competence protein ComEC